MIELGVKQKLYIDHKTDFGVQLSDTPERNGKSDCVLLPKKQVPQNAKIGDEVEVFEYRDSKDREIATTNMPKLQLGELAVLQVAQVNNIGGFMYWGLEKDLLLPYSEQVVKVQKGEKYLVGLYIDKSDRLCATMKVYDFLRTDSPYKTDDIVEGTVYGKNPEYGVFVAVDNKYNGMLQNKEIVRKLKIGEKVQARVLSVREDGKLNLSLREKAYLQMDVDSAKILEKLKENDGFLPYHDKSAPEDIRSEFGMSKNEFKRAIGRLYKSKKIKISKTGIELTEEQTNVTAKIFKSKQNMVYNRIAAYSGVCSGFSACNPSIWKNNSSNSDMVFSGQYTGEKYTAYRNLHCRLYHNYFYDVFS